VSKFSQGIFVTLSSGPIGDVDYGEVVSISIDGIQADSVEITPRTSTSRKKLFRPSDTDDGTASVVMRVQNSMTDAYVGTTTLLEIYDIASPFQTYWNGVAIIQSLAWRASVGELQEYSVTFKLGATT
jgi:hypothetical protein